jgi:hypothetical protein
MDFATPNAVRLRPVTILLKYCVSEARISFQGLSFSGARHLAALRIIGNVARWFACIHDLWT